MDKRLRALHYSVVLKGELSKTAKLSVSTLRQFLSSLTLTYSHEYWMMNNDRKSAIQASVMRFLRKMEEVMLFDKVRSSNL